MLFLNNQSSENKENYIKLLKAVSSLSNLFSDSNIPYINYRVAENIFCKSFNAENLARSDSSYDARKEKIGIGIKTFISQSISKFEKISEFNTLSKKLKYLKSYELAEKLADYRNERIDFADRSYNIENGLYHCITRSDKKLIIYESEYYRIDKNSIKIIKDQEASLHFKDKYRFYLFNHSKSTLFQKFEKPDNSLEIDIDILDDPFELLLKMLESSDVTFNNQIGTAGIDYVILPLYSIKMSKEGNKIVPDKSQLNQWNAAGRPRKSGEVYIPIPISIHKKFPSFFPSRDKIFSLKTPDNEILSAKICQENSKALMTNPNNALEHWLLRKVLKLKPRKLLTYEKLLEIGNDSVIVTKKSPFKYEIDFSPIDSFDSFQSKYL